MSKSELKVTKHVIICTPAVAKYSEINFRESKRLLPHALYVPDSSIF